ncbi:kinase-like domain-containing protein [Fimicolochytrium jonesii]|uniref:kinase-like domain-containing protein n=1 Tax=Fimicolochytrium jonesii TaxID=1396493 RepID=UPI0022FEF0F0|nr:kinase-like domain-containing protein [Fimicolochytrium jonesii]KAI8818175.1 kinase-like domain-containing protein [Fimicolochytrium jonesii]
MAPLEEEDLAPDPSIVYACKELRLDLKEQTEGAWGYAAELENLGGLDHPHLVKLRCSYTQNHKAYIIMSPYAPLTLLSFMKNPDACAWYVAQTSPQRREMTLGWMSCMSSALVYLHDAEMKHKDIKPDNILIDCDHCHHENYPLPVLTDFGISKKFSLSQGSDSRGQSGTFFWQAPEHMRSEPAGRAADVFALGGIFLLLLALGHGNTTETIIAALRGETIPASGFAAKLDEFVVPYIDDVSKTSDDSKSAWYLVKEMLASTPSERPTARNVWTALKGIMEESGFRPHCSALPRTPKTSHESPERSVGGDDILDTTTVLARLKLERQSSNTKSW